MKVTQSFWSAVFVSLSVRLFFLIHNFLYSFLTEIAVQCIVFSQETHTGDIVMTCLGCDPTIQNHVMVEVRFKVVER